MKIKDLREAIKDLPDDGEVILVGWDGKDVKKTTHRCANHEHQQKQGQLWLSLEGFLIKE